ncbi:unnamed protein product [Closterium sp. NIES-54]
MKRVTWKEKLQSLEQGEASPLRRTTCISRPPERFTPSAQYACMHDHEVHDLEECMLVDAEGVELGLDFCLMGQVHEPKSVKEALSHPEWVESMREELESHRLYQSIVGSLMYASTTTQPQIAYAMSQLSKVVSCPKAFHLQVAKRVLRYLKGCVKLGIFYPTHSKPQVELVGFSDADYAGDSVDRKSHTGYVCCLNAEPRRPAEPRHPAEPRRPAEPRCPLSRAALPSRTALPHRTALHCPPASAAIAATAAPLATAPIATMASPTVLTFDAEGRAVDFDVWVDNSSFFSVILGVGTLRIRSTFSLMSSCQRPHLLGADKLSSRAVPCVFLGFPPDAPGWQFYHPTSRLVLSSQDVTFDESVSYYHLFPYRTASLPPPPLFLVPGTPPVDPLPP